MFAALKSGAPLPVIPKSVPPPAAAPAPSSEPDFGGQRNDRNLQVKVYNIPEGSDDNDLRNHFACCGEVVSVRILPLRDGKVTTLGFVGFSNMDGVRKACDEKNNEEFNGSPLRVMESAPRDGGSNNRSDGGSRGGSGSGGGGGGGYQVKVYNIPESTEEEALKAYFGSIGEVTRVKILPCREGKDVTLGFIHFNSEDECNRAISELNEQEFNGSNLRVQSANQNGPISGSGRSSGAFFAGSGASNVTNGFSGNCNGVANDEKPRSGFGRGAQLMINAGQTTDVNGAVGRQARGPQAKVFGIPEGTDHNELKEFFASAGEVKFVKVLPLREGKDTCLGFIEFATDDEVENAVSSFDGQEFNGSPLKVMVGSSSGGGGGVKFNQMNGSGQPWGNNSSGPTGRLPREERPPRDAQNGDSIMLPDAGDSNNACRRCGETGHWARECVNAPMANGAQAVTYIPPPPPETEEEIFQQGIHQGINFDNFDCIPVEFTGENAPKPFASFAEAQLHQNCVRNIERSKYEKPTPVQKYAIPAILGRRDLMACAQTGSGKTGAFLLPMITNMLNEGVSQESSCGEPAMPVVCILSPTRELTIQIFHEAKRFSYGTNIKPVVVYGGVSVNHQISRLEMGCHILVATPGRLDDFVKRGRINFKNLQYLVLDEADKMLDMGFGPQIEQIINNSEMPPKGDRVTLMFSATFPEAIQQMAAKFLNDYLFLTVGRVGGTCADVKQVIMEVQGSEKRNTLEKLLQESGTDRTLVFVERKKDADFLASFLSQRNYPATSLNADRSQQEREQALSDFRKGKAPVLVATAVAARGLDINDVKHVINYDLPSDSTEYVHRIGRTGRIGNKGLATSFFDAGRDQKLARGLVKLLSEAEQTVPDWLEETALRAVGTGYGTDNGQFRDQRPKFGGSGGGGGGGSSASKAAVVDDDDEEW